MADVWREATLGQLLTLEYGKALPERDRDGEGHPVFGSSGVVGRHSQALVSGPGIVVGRKGTAGSVLWSQGDFFPIDTTYWVNMRDAESTDLRFIALLLEWVDLPGICAQTGVPGLNRDRAYEIPVRLPSLPEQRRIVDLIGALDAQIDALDTEGQALRTLLVSQREVLVESATWEPIAAMTRESGIQIGPFGAQLHAYDYVELGVPVVMPQDIIDGEIRTEKIKYVSEAMASTLARHRLEPGDLVLPRRGDLTKRALVREDQRGWLCGTGSIRIRLAEPSMAPMLLEGLSTRATDEWLETNAVGTTMLNLNTEIVSKIPAPRFRDAGRALAEACIATRTQVKGLEDELASVRGLRATMLGGLLDDQVKIPDFYDALLAETA